MANRRTVGQRRRKSENSGSRVRAAVQAAREKVSRESDGRKGIDARAYGDDREGVDAAETEVDDEAVERVSGGPQRSRVQQAKRAASERISELTDIQKEKLKDKNARAAVKQALAAATIATDGAPEMDSSRDNIGTRAARSAAIGSPIRGGLRPVGDERVVSEMARMSAAEGNELLDFGAGGLNLGAGAGVGASGSAAGPSLSLGFDGSLLDDAGDNEADESDDNSALNVGLSNVGVNI
ncbi:hypothetical protein [Halobellus sp. Atlit-38R]|uniref:hypothetical protein n=1 Tax=Halobellus sp. Atlit-38R TaxID=2282131 RepID=UPI0011C35A64|nr:hypothetical protein [Halobellus sp. Atlit-38R]